MGSSDNKHNKHTIVAHRHRGQPPTKCYAQLQSTQTKQHQATRTHSQVCTPSATVQASLSQQRTSACARSGPFWSTPHGGLMVHQPTHLRCHVRTQAVPSKNHLSQGRHTGMKVKCMVPWFGSSGGHSTTPSRRDAVLWLCVCTTHTHFHHAHANWQLWREKCC
jgi:hypothetical protein